MSRVPTCVALVDCNNFFASCERMVDPRLEGVPVAVLSSNDGCIIARSEEVKDIGIPMGAPWFKWREHLDKHGVRLFSLNMQLYTETSARIMNLLIKRVPKVQVYSIDEAFLDLSGMEKYFDLEQFLQQLRQDIWNEVGIPVSIGVAPSKALSKLANSIAKKQKTTYVEFLMDKDKREQVLRATPVEKIWGVGRQNTARLNNAGVLTAWDMANLNPKQVQKMRSVIEGRLVLELRGEYCFPIEEPPEVKQHIGSSRSFGERITQLNDLKGAFTFLMGLATHKLVRQRSACKVILLTAYIGKPRDPERSKTRAVITLPEHNHYPPVLLQAVLERVPDLFKPGASYYKAAVTLHDLCSVAQVKSDLFFDLKYGKQERLLNTMGSLNKDRALPQVEWAGFKATNASKPWVPKCDRMSVPSVQRLTDEELDKARPWW